MHEYKYKYIQFWILHVESPACPLIYSLRSITPKQLFGQVGTWKARKSTHTSTHRHSIAQRNLDNLDARIGGQSFVQLNNMSPVRRKILRHWFLRHRHRPVPQRVIVHHNPANLQQFQHSLVIVFVVYLVSIHVREVETRLVLLLQNSIISIKKNTYTGWFVGREMCFFYSSLHLPRACQEQAEPETQWSWSCAQFLPSLWLATPFHMPSCQGLRL